MPIEIAEQNPFQEMANNWPSTHVARSKVAEFSGGLLHHRTMANLDSLGQGPTGRVRLGRSVGYEKHALVDWMWSRTVQPAEKR